MAGYDDGLDPRQPCDLKVPEYTSLVCYCLSICAVDYQLDFTQLTIVVLVFISFVILFVYQLTGKIENMKIGILREGFALSNSEADVDRTVREAAEQLGSKCGAVVEEVSIPMHSDGN